MNSLEDIVAAAKAKPMRIVLSEGEDPRIAEGAVRANSDGIAKPVLIGSRAIVEQRLSDAGGDPSDFEIIDPRAYDQHSAYAEAFFELRQHKGVDADQASAAMRDPLQLAAMMVRVGDGDGTIGGAVHTTADTVRAAFQIIGRAEGIRTVSSFFLMFLDPQTSPGKSVLMFADCALIVEPSADELAQIAMSCAKSMPAFTGSDPRIAMLSFSTLGSAKHERADKVRAATDIARETMPDLIIDGEIQFDAAFVPSVAKSKAPNSPLGGDANVFVFPNLESGNIGYKIAQRIGGARAIGPILQGLAHPANDLSRGCSADDVYHLIALTGVQAAAL